MRSGQPRARAVCPNGGSLKNLDTHIISVKAKVFGNLPKANRLRGWDSAHFPEETGLVLLNTSHMLFYNRKITIGILIGKYPRVISVNIILLWYFSFKALFFFQGDKTAIANKLKAAESTETLDQSTDDSDQVQVKR